MENIIKFIALVIFYTAGVLNFFIGNWYDSVIAFALAFILLLLSINSD
jgi:uncharacterized membrane protein YjjP (DUF1212 family)